MHSSPRSPSGTSAPPSLRIAASVDEIGRPIEPLYSVILIGLMAVLVLPAIAAKRLTVAQLEESLSAENAVHHSDAELARQIGDFELSERLTDSTLNRLAARLKLSPRTALALQLLADQSALLDPPASELPSTGAPDAAAQQQGERGHAMVRR